MRESILLCFSISVLLLLYAIHTKRSGLIRPGQTITVLGLFVFYVTDWLRNQRYVDAGFVYRYCIVMGISTLLAVYLNRTNASEVKSSQFTRWFTRITAVGVWFGLLQVTGDIYYQNAGRSFYFELYRQLLAAMLSMGLGFFLAYTRINRDKVLRIFGCACVLLGAGMLVWLEVYYLPVPDTVNSGFQAFAAPAALLLGNVLAVIIIGLLWKNRKYRKIQRKEEDR